MQDIQSTEQPPDLSTLFDKLDRNATLTLFALLETNSAREAAEKLGVDRTTVYWRINRYGLDKIIAQIPRQAVARLQLGAIKAAETMVGLLDAKDEKIKLEASKETLNRVGIGGGPDVVVQAPVQVNFPEEFLKYDNVSPSPNTVDSSQGPDQVPSG